MIKKTKEYDIFIFRDDNRDKIDQSHVRRIAESMRSRNMLELCPVIVNEQMEIINGQHRVLAAKMIGAEVFYKVESKLSADDIIRLNLSKSWGIGDYLNFYCHHQNDNYIKLKNFMTHHNLTLKVALNICMGGSKEGFIGFKSGKFIFDEDEMDVELEVCWETIHYIKKMNGFSPYTSSSRFWKALLKLVRHPEFDAKKWKANVQKMTDSFCAKARTEEYVSMVQKVYNWGLKSKISLVEDDL